ncbi:MAG TPA: hypothetical protein PLO43_00965 [Chlamydiales bacterium]|nr:hypothetical protein [Chlamydiales bacterium]HPE84736.1 hypothetical protein [Chlamydiales bacterium]
MNSQTIAPTTSLTQLAEEIQKYGVNQSNSALALFSASKESVNASEHYASQMQNSASSEKGWNEAASYFNLGMLVAGVFTLGAFLPGLTMLSGGDRAVNGLVKLGVATTNVGQATLNGNVQIESAEASATMETGQDAANKAGKLNGEEAMQTVSALYSANNIVGQAV